MTSVSLNEILPYTFGSEIEYLHQMGKNLLPGSVVVMLGVGPAVMAIALLEGADGTPFQFYGVDINNFTGLEHLKAAGFADKVYPINDYSWDAAQRFSHKSVDVLIVDACHDYDCVSKDIQAWWSKVKTGGIVFFHDYRTPDGQLNEDVRGAIKLFQSDSWVELAQPGISIVFKKE